MIGQRQTPLGSIPGGWSELNLAKFDNPDSDSTSANGRLCCKSLKTPGDKFPARSRNKPRSLIDVASGSLPKSPVSLSPGDEVPHMFTRKPRLQLEKFAINGAVSNGRIWAGFHYRFSTRVGTDMGHQIGEYVVKNVMQPAVTSSR